MVAFVQQNDIETEQNISVFLKTGKLNSKGQLHTVKHKMFFPAIVPLKLYIF